MGIITFCSLILRPAAAAAVAAVAPAPERGEVADAGRPARLPNEVAVAAGVAHGGHRPVVATAAAAAGGCGRKPSSCVEFRVERERESMFS